MKNNKKYYITLTVIATLSLLLILVLLAFSDKSEVAFNCKVVDLEWRDVSPSSCWGGFNETYCPLPHSFECDVRAKGFGWLLTDVMFKDLKD